MQQEIKGLLQMKTTKQKPREKEFKIEYYILAGIPSLLVKFIEKDIDISPTHLMVVKEYSKLGRAIKKEVKSRLKIK